MNLADIPVSYGLIRVDKMRLFRPNMSLTLGSYGFPDDGSVEIMRKNGKYFVSTVGGIKKRRVANAVILKGYDSQGRKKQLAMTVYTGWQKLDIAESIVTNPDSEKSLIVYAGYEKKNLYDSSENYVLISQTITKESHEDFADSELFPIKKVIFSDTDGTGAYGDIVLSLDSACGGPSTIKVNYEKMEGRLML